MRMQFEYGTKKLDNFLRNKTAMTRFQRIRPKKVLSFDSFLLKDLLNDLSVKKFKKKLNR